MGDLAAILPFVFLAIWVVSQIMQAGKAARDQRPGGGQQPRRRPVPREGQPPRAGGPPRGGQPQGAGKAGDQAEGEMREEIELFLRRAAEQKERGEQEQEAQPPRRRRPQSPGRTGLPRPQRRRRSEPLVTTSDTLLDEPLEGELVEAERKPIGSLKASFTSGVEPRHGSGESREARDSIDQSDERLQEHLKDVFSHQLGSLSTQERKSHQRKMVNANLDSLASILRNPTNFRQAIILNEILQPPESRW